MPPERRLRKEEAAARTSLHGLAPAKRGLSLVQRSFVARRASTTHAIRRTCTASAHGAPPSERQRAQWHARACHPKGGCAKSRPQLAHHYTVLHRRRGVCRWFSALSLYAERLYLTQYGARALQARMVRPLPRDSVRSGTPARATRKPAAQRGGRSSHVKPRSYTGEERSLAGVATSHRIWSDYNTRGTARAPCKRECNQMPK